LTIFQVKKHNSPYITSASSYLIRSKFDADSRSTEADLSQPQAASAGNWVGVARANAANSCLLDRSNPISDGVSRLGAGEIPSF